MCLERIPYEQCPDGFWNTLYYDGKPVRMYYNNDMFWWATKDVCGLIGLGNASRAAARLDDDEKMTLTLSDSHSGQRGGAQKLLLINEPGLYHLLLTSGKPKAKPFRRWIMFDVLPSIRRNGGYIMGQDTMNAAKLTEAAAKFAHNVMAEQNRQSEELRIERKAQNALIRKLESKAAYCDAVLHSNDAIPITLIAKDYGLSAQALNKYLYDNGVQYPCGGTWVLYQCYAGRGYVQPETILYSNTHCRQHTRWTQKGRAFIYELLKSDGILPLSERINFPADMEDFWLPQT